MRNILAVFTAFISLASAIVPLIPDRVGGINGKTHEVKPSFNLTWKDDVHNTDMCIYLWDYQHSCMAAALLAKDVVPSKEYWTLTADLLNDKNTLMTCVDSDTNCKLTSCAPLYGSSSPVRKDIQYQIHYYYNCSKGVDHNRTTDREETVQFYLDW